MARGIGFDGRPRQTSAADAHVIPYTVYKSKNKKYYGKKKGYRNDVKYNNIVYIYVSII